MVNCYIGFGSNLGDREYYIRTAAKRIHQMPLTSQVTLSSLIETEPEGGPAQGNFLNAVGAMKTALSPYALLVALQEIEQSLGRVRSGRNNPRTIDLDILLYGEFRLNETALVIPHPRMAARAFVLIPLEEIAPGLTKRFLITGGRRK